MRGREGRERRKGRYRNWEEGNRRVREKMKTKTITELNTKERKTFGQEGNDTEGEKEGKNISEGKVD